MAGDISQIIGPAVANANQPAPAVDDAASKVNANRPAPTAGNAALRVNANRPAPAADNAAPKVSAGRPAATPGDTVSLSTQAQRAQRSAGTQNPFQPLAVPGASQKIRSFTETNRLVTQVVDPVTHKVVRQLPSEGEVRLREAIRNLVSEKNQTD